MPPTLGSTRKIHRCLGYTTPLRGTHPSLPKERSSFLFMSRGGVGCRGFSQSATRRGSRPKGSKGGRGRWRTGRQGKQGWLNRLTRSMWAVRQAGRGGWLCRLGQSAWVLRTFATPACPRRPDTTHPCLSRIFLGRQVHCLPEIKLHEAPTPARLLLLLPNQ